MKYLKFLFFALLLLIFDSCKDSPLQAWERARLEPSISGYPNEIALSDWETYLHKRENDIKLDKIIFKGILEDRSDIASYTSDFSAIYTNDINYNLPFVWQTEMPSSVLPLYKFNADGVTIFIVGYGWSSTSTNEYQVYAQSYDSSGQFKNISELNSFNHGKTDNPEMNAASFSKIFGNCCSEFKFNGDTLFTKTAKLKVFYSGTEDLHINTQNFLLKKDGLFEKVSSDTDTLRYSWRGNVTTEGHNFKF